MSKSGNYLNYELSVKDDGVVFATSISSAMNEAESELEYLNNQLNESYETIKRLTPECDKLDYALSASSGVLCGIIDIFLVGKPGESPLGNITDEWFGDRTKDFANLCCPNKDNSTMSSAIRNLETKFKIPYDQSVGGDIVKELLNLTPSNHHFKSLGHNPTILGLFFSILNQFINTSEFVTNGELISLNNSDSKFELHGNDIPSKLFCGMVNWLGHLISDVSGSSSCKGRGMGIPSPIFAWSNDIIAIKQKLNIPTSQFDKSVNEMALNIYTKGYDVRFQTAQAIPVFINEMTVRVIYATRRLIAYFINTNKKNRTLELMWKSCEPFSNVTVKRMLIVAHGTFCLIDLGDATIRGLLAGGGNLDITEFVMRLNIVGVGRFAVSLYGEANRGIKLFSVKSKSDYLEREKVIVLDYISGLELLSDVYDDKDLLTFVDDLQNSNLYIKQFEKTIELAKKRLVPEKDILDTKDKIDLYFNEGNKND